VVDYHDGFTYHDAARNGRCKPKVARPEGLPLGARPEEQEHQVVVLRKA
jgi:hypothetical protein